MSHDPADLIHLFNTCFSQTWQVQLIGGAEEPLYLPATHPADYHTIYFTKDYFSSALHECAHWFIAGPARRLQVDYGYWYEPDGRDALQQKRFQAAEIKPQAIECILSRAAKHTFQASLDNLDGCISERVSFEKAIFEQVDYYETTGLPPRAEIFKQALRQFYSTL